MKELRAAGIRLVDRGSGTYRALWTEGETACQADLHLESVGRGRFLLRVLGDRRRRGVATPLEKGAVLGDLHHPSGLEAWRWSTPDGAAGTKLIRDRAVFCVLHRHVARG